MGGASGPTARRARAAASCLRCRRRSPRCSERERLGLIPDRSSGAHTGWPILKPRAGETIHLRSRKHLNPDNPESWPHTCVLAGQWMKSLLKLLPAYRLTVVFVLATGVPCRMEPQGAHSRPSAAAERAEVKNVFWQPDEVKQGSPVMISVELS